MLIAGMEFLRISLLYQVFLIIIFTLIESRKLANIDWSYSNQRRLFPLF